MDGVNAVTSRVSEIHARMAELARGPGPSATGDFAGVLARVVETGGTRVAQSLATGSAPGSASANAGLGAQRIDGWIAQALAATGAPPEWAAELRTIAERESGLNPLATNGNDPIGNGRTQRVVGLMQMLPSTFAAHAAPGRSDIFNPVDNLISAIGYIRGRYGTPADVPGIKALARGDAYRGY